MSGGGYDLKYNMYIVIILESALNIINCFPDAQTAWYDGYISYKYITY